MKKEKSEQAKVAAIIRKELKARGIAFESVKSQSFAGGNAVDVRLRYNDKNLAESLEKEFKRRFEYRSFEKSEEGITVSYITVTEG